MLSETYCQAYVPKARNLPILRLSCVSRYYHVGVNTVISPWLGSVRHRSQHKPSEGPAEAAALRLSSLRED